MGIAFVWRYTGFFNIDSLKLGSGIPVMILTGLVMMVVACRFKVSTDTIHFGRRMFTMVHIGLLHLWPPYE